MRLLHNGEWKPDATRDQYTHDTFDAHIEGSVDAEVPAEAGRCHLSISWACPWAHRTALTRRLLGFEDVVSVDVVDHAPHDQGWEFSSEKANCTSDSVHSHDTLCEVYQEAAPDYTGRVTVPILYDWGTDTIVHEESAAIARVLASESVDYASEPTGFVPVGPELDWATVDERDELPEESTAIDEVNT